ncbi:MAG TPA: glycosyltransferase, partial [Herpetosiphonaceae bacterium]|nr:glycosyltransferase [Herpetosiphonaceae bacterium]
MAHHIDLGIVVVSWNVREHLRRCLRSIDESLGGRRISYRTVVVDNASHDGSAEMVRAEFPHVEVIANATNRGFAGGNNDGFRALGLLQAVG